MVSAKAPIETGMKPTTADSYQERILRVLVHIQSHLDEPLSLDQLAGVACFSPFHFHRVFRGMTGESLMEHVRRLRLERAASRLRTASTPVTQLAFDAGYESHEAFTRSFHAAFGVSPSDYRENHRKPDQLDAASGVHYDDLGAFKTPDYPGGLNVTIRTIEPMKVVFIRHIGDYDQVGPTWGRLMAWVGQHGLFGPATKMIGICWDDPSVTPMDKVRYDAAVPVNRPVQPEGEVGVQEIAGGEYATVVHKGAYQTLGSTYDRIFGAWLPASGRELRDDPAFEVYLNSPQTARPEDLETLIHVPLS